MDIYASAHALVSTRSPAAYPVGFLLGIVSSLGPCAVTRYAAIARSSAAASRPWRAVVAFIAGVVVIYALFGVTSALLAYTQAVAAVVYSILAIVFVFWGVRTALDVDTHDHTHGETCDVPTGRISRAWHIISGPARALSSAIERRVGSTSLLGVFILGALSACTVSPCCAPFLGLTAAVAAQSHDPIFGSTLLSVFALGHALPLLGYGAAGMYLTSLGNRAPALRHVVAVFFAALMIGTGVTYALQI